MGNEKSVYELRLEEKDKIINFQQNIINKLISYNDKDCRTNEMFIVLFDLLLTSGKVG